MNDPVERFQIEAQQRFKRFGKNKRKPLPRVMVETQGKPKAERLKAEEPLNLPDAEFMLLQAIVGLIRLNASGNNELQSTLDELIAKAYPIVKEKNPQYIEELARGHRMSLTASLKRSESKRV